MMILIGGLIILLEVIEVLLLTWVLPFHNIGLLLPPTVRTKLKGATESMSVNIENTLKKVFEKY